jgi:predicted dienelactone hydrolase
MRRLLRYVIRIALAAAFAGAVVLLLLWIEHRRSVELPAPTGPLTVGRTTVPARDFRLWIRYPSAAAAPGDDYLPAATRAEWEASRPSFINFLTADLSKVRSHAARDVAVSTAGAPYPVVILGGGGSGTSGLSFSTLAEDLASHGYIVVSVDAAAGRNPELCVGRQDEDACAMEIMGPLVERIGRALDRLKALSIDDPRFQNRIDLTRVGVVGHSFGGAQAAQFCAQDPRCSAGIDLDGRLFSSVVRSGLSVPFMFLLSDHGALKDPIDRQIMDQIQAVYDRQPRDTRMRAFIRGAHHFTFSDDGALLKSAVFRILLRSLGRLHIDGRRQVVVTAYALRTFFDAHLKGGSGWRTAFTSPAYPELVELP